MKENAYFDNAATTWPKPESVYRFMDSFFRSHGVNPGRSGSELALEAEQMITSTRRMLAGCLGFSGPVERVVFTLNGTDALNLAMTGLLDAGDHVIATRLDHNAVLRVANHLERDAGIRITRVAPADDGYVTVDALRQAITADTRCIVLNHASNVIGTVQPLAEVGELAREHGLALIVDSAQTAGVVPIDMDAHGISVLTFTGHKGLFGPMGVGGMIVAEGLALRPGRVGGTGINSRSPFQPEDYPHRLEAGTLPLPGIAGLHAAQVWLAELGAERRAAGALSVSKSHGELCNTAMQHIHATEMDHLHRIEALLQTSDAVRILGRARDDARVAVLSFVVRGFTTERIADQLDADHHIIARAGLQCAPLVHVDAGTADGGGAIRLSPGYFTDESDMQQLLDALRDILSDA